MNTLLTRITANKHTSIAAGIYCGAKLLSNLGSIWFPEHKAQFDQTADAIESAAVGYGFIMAGDSKPTDKISQPTIEQTKTN